MAGDLELLSLPDGVAREQQDEHRSGHDAGGKELVHADGGDEGIEDDGEAGREEQSEAARGRDQAEGEPFGVLFIQEHRVEQAAEGHDCHPGGPGECSEKSTRDERHDRKPPREGAEKGACEIHHPDRRLAFSERIAGKGEEGYGDQGRVRGNPVQVHHHHGRADALAREGQHGNHPDDGKQGGSEQGHQEYSEADQECLHQAASAVVLPKAAAPLCTIFSAKCRPSSQYPRGMINRPTHDGMPRNSSDPETRSSSRKVQADAPRK